MTFLRTDPKDSSSLPRGVQLSSLTQSTSSSLFNAKLEVLLDLREEASYLGLDSLSQLCTNEIRQKLGHNAPKHTQGSNNPGVNSVVEPGTLPPVDDESRSQAAQGHHLPAHSLYAHVEFVEGGLTVPILDHVAKPQGWGEIDTGADPPSSFPTSPSLVPLNTTTTETTPSGVAAHHFENSPAQSLQATNNLPIAPPPSSRTPSRPPSPSLSQASIRPQDHTESRPIRAVTTCASPTHDSGTKSEGRSKGKNTTRQGPPPIDTSTMGHLSFESSEGVLIVSKFNDLRLKADLLRGIYACSEFISPISTPNRKS